MNQEEIGKIIKDLRKKENLTQEEFASIFHVTYQAVSKWENGKCLPDILILKEMAKKYNLDINMFLEGESKKNPKRKLRLSYFLAGGIIICLLLVSVIITKIPNEDFKFLSIYTTEPNFNIYGSIAYNSKKTTIYIANITYEGDINKTYKEIECGLYEQNDKIISEADFKKEDISLSEFLKNVEFNVNHYSRNCHMYEDNELYVKIKTVDSANNSKCYLIPIRSSICENSTIS